MENEIIPSEPIKVPASESNDLITARKEGSGSALAAFFGAEVAARMNNFEGSPQERWRLAALGSGSSVGRLSEMTGQTINVVFISCTRVEVSLEKGEIVPAIRTVVYDDKLNRFATVSDGIAASACEIFSVFGLKKFDPPIALRVDEQRTRKGYKVLQLVPAE